MSSSCSRLSSVQAIAVKACPDLQSLVAKTKNASQGVPQAKWIPAPQFCFPPEYRRLSSVAEAPMENSISSLTSASHSDAELQKVLVCISRSSATFPLYHMEFMELPDSRWMWKETHPLDSPRLLVQLKMHSASYKQLGLWAYTPVKPASQTVGRPKSHANRRTCLIFGSS